MKPIGLEVRAAKQQIHLRLQWFVGSIEYEIGIPQTIGFRIILDK